MKRVKIHLNMEDMLELLSGGHIRDPKNEFPKEDVEKTIQVLNLEDNTTPLERLIDD